MEKNLIKPIAEKKLKAFSIGTIGKRPISKKEIEEQRKKEQDQAAAQIFGEFIATFQDNSTSNVGKVWIKAGTYDAGKRYEDTRDKGKVYKPQLKLSDNGSIQEQDKIKLFACDEPKLEGLGKKKREVVKRKSNLELLKEELKMIHEEREGKYKYQGGSVNSVLIQRDDAMLGAVESAEGLDNGDPNTTNLYIGNLNPTMTEQQIMEIFGKFGPLASVKIMYPRSDEERARQRNCGFVAFMCRKDGERALKNLRGKEIMSYELKLSWGKSVPIPPYPIYIPPVLMEIIQPPPLSGLPFNAQPHRRDKDKIQRNCHFQSEDPKEMENFKKVLQNAVVKVVIPTNRNLIMLIHRMIEFVVREGPMFEAMIMNREINNPMFRFLYENHSPVHAYYRWKLFSILQGDTQKEWRTEDFRMFQGGSIWRPPPMNLWTRGMPDGLIEVEEGQDQPRESLSDSQRDRLENLLRNIVPERLKVAEAMVFCIEHAEAAEEICDCISESLSILQTPVSKKIARLYLISDILHNSSAKVTNATIYRKAFESRLLKISKEVFQAYKQFDSRLKAEAFKVRVMKILKAWEDWSVYPREFLVHLKNIFLGLNQVREVQQENKEDINGTQLSDIDGDDAEDLDGIPLDGAAFLKEAMERGLTPQVLNDDSIDGMTMEDDIDGIPMESNDDSADFKIEDVQKLALPAGFIPSKWETVDPDQVQAQAMTTDKWEELGPNERLNLQSKSKDSRDDVEERRKILREIEVKAMQYQDELESGKRSLKEGRTIESQVDRYRKKLIKKRERMMKENNSEDKDDDRRKDKRSSPLDSPSYRSRKHSNPSPPSKGGNRYSRSLRERRSRSPCTKSLQYTPSPPRVKRSPSPTYSRRFLSRQSPTERKRRRSPSLSPISSRSSKYRAASPASPVPRKNYHKHKY